MVALVYKRSSEVPPPRYSSPLLPSSPFPLKFSSTTTPGSVSRNRMSLPKLCLLRLPPTPLPALRLRTRQPRPSPQSAASLVGFTARFDRGQATIKPRSNRGQTAVKPRSNRGLTAAKPCDLTACPRWCTARLLARLFFPPPFWPAAFTPPLRPSAGDDRRGRRRALAPPPRPNRGHAAV